MGFLMNKGKVICKLFKVASREELLSNYGDTRMVVPVMWDQCCLIIVNRALEKHIIIYSQQKK